MTILDSLSVLLYLPELLAVKTKLKVLDGMFLMFDSSKVASIIFFSTAAVIFVVLVLASR